ncbi:MAG TPA: ABC transporter permease [Vicinamibacterales bacterium]|nr:ABC transporter permease [Vicinamibacterales bacterium]
MRLILELMQRWRGLLRRSRNDADLAEELRVHLEMAAEHELRRAEVPAAAARAARVRAGGQAQAMERLRDQRSLPSLEALAADVVFGWRQLRRHRTASVSAILSLGLALGATMAAFRLVDTMLLRPLPVADPARLFVTTTVVRDMDGHADERDDFDYPTYRKYVELAGGQADLILMGAAVRRPILVSGEEPEGAIQQFVSGNVFATLGLRPALGRLISEADDVVPNGHPIAVISYDYWQRRFGGDSAVIGSTFRIGSRPIEIIGVAPRGFTGSEPGAVTDFFLPSMMNPEALKASGWSWFRIWVRPKPGIDPGQVQAQLQARYHADHVEHAKEFAADTPQARVEAYLNEQLLLRPAAAGVSAVQKSFRRPLWILSALAGLLLLIACANVANLLLARAMSRRTEMALRLSIGAARGRLIQLMLVESALLAVLSGVAGAAFASWAAPFVVSMLAPADRPVRLILEFDWRALALGTGLTLIVTMLFGIVPALRASAITPVDALKATRGPGGQRRLTDVLVSAQMALCVFLLFGASLFVGTFAELQKRPLGFDPVNLVHITVEGRERLTPETWAQLAAGLTDLPRVEAAAVAGWAPLTGNRWRSSVTVAGRPPESDAPNWVSVSPGYFETMRMRLLEGREFRSGDTSPKRDALKRPVPGVAVVNETFARVYFNGTSPVGRRVTVASSSVPMEIVGMVADAVYSNVREPRHPAVYIPLEPREGATLLIRTDGPAADLHRVLRQEVVRLRPGIQVRELAPFEAFVTQQMIRERLLASLSTFFAVLALLLAAIGMYGVLNYAVTRERREIGLRMALGARPGHVVGLISTRLLGMVCLGAIVGMAGGLLFGRAVGSLLFQMEPTNPVALLAPIIALGLAAMMAALPPAMRAVRIDPAQTIKSDG